LAGKLSGKLSGKVLVTYAYGGPQTYSGAPLTPRSKLKELGEKLLSGAQERGGGTAVPIETELVNDSAAQGLLSVAHKHGAEMIVVGTHGESPISAMLLGSTAYKLVHTSTMPVLVVPASTKQREVA
jgi:nucleotide-binding universal stress UspA family protein